MATGSRAFSNETPRKPHLLRSGGIGGEVADLRRDAESGFYRLERRDGYPRISRVVGGTAVSLAGLPTAAEMVGTGFLQGQEKASLEVGTGTAKLTFTANRPGEPGNDISVALIDSTGGGLSVAVTGSAIEIDKGGATPDADAVKAAVDGDSDAAALVQVVSGGAGAPGLFSETSLSGGVGEGLTVSLNGIEQVVSGSVTDTSIPLVISDLTGAANGDAAVLQVESDGVTSDPISLGVVT